MNTMQAEKTARFRQRIQFDTAFAAEGIEQAAVLRWPDMRDAPGLGQPVWTVAADTLWREGGGAVREWVLRRGRETLSVLAFVSSSGPEPARAYLLARASNNMMVDVPYVRGPQALGTLSLTAKAPAPPFFLWTFRNLCLEVKARDTAVDAAAIAAWLQALAARSLVGWAELARAAPLGARADATPGTVGRVLKIAVQPPADAAPAHHLLQVEVAAERAQVVGQTAAEVEIKPLLPGPLSVQLHWVDSQTLMARTARVEIEVAPPGAQAVRP